MDSSSLEFLICVFLFLFIYGSCKHESEIVPGSSCARPCEVDTPPLTCYFRFEVESYYTMSKACYNCPYNISHCFLPDCIPADGVGRVITVVNRKLPGPSIQVCLGDTIVVDVVNSMVEESTSIHWHGHHQKFTPYMDGVPFITQCPIAAGTTFRYLVKAIHTGTHFWHSHTGIQRADGAFGSMIIRQPEVKETHASLYDYDLQEHVIQLIDWIHESTQARFQSHYQAGGSNKPNTILVNGMGQFKEFPLNDKTLYTPVAKFNVEQGQRYRFRVISAGVLYCPIQISVDDHTIIVISSDGSDIKPLHTESFTVYAGERWDFIINANNNASNYWMKFRGLNDCGEKYHKVFALGVLHYRGAPNTLPPSVVTYKDTDRQGMHLNAVNKAADEEYFTTAAEISAAREVINDKSLKEEPDISLTLSFDFYAVDNSMFQRRGLYGFKEVTPKLRTYTPQINHISMKMPSFPPLSEPELITPDTFCNESTVQNCETEFCSCVYKIDLPLHAVVELMFIDEGLVYESNHPFHLHGHSFRVISIDKLGNFTTVDQVMKHDRAGKIHRNLHNPPLKDTVTVPDGGYTIVRFYTHNPGYWLLHCHLDFHVEVGMALVFRVGEEKDFPPVPKDFPRCGNYYNRRAPDTTQTNVPTTTTHPGPDIFVYHTSNSTKNHTTNVIESIWSSFYSSGTSSHRVTNNLLSICAFILCYKYLFL